ncbi:uncharacterized protein NMK_2122 [Novimethylophilus kurashikiensis]|uniref:Uncharacterized protein n=1 Tax=Novimethylophilus kurashikiensis TaxID=1825523 RepID=A0A2R5FC64_9PROT|nr:hypothetical protein [Novimethylophilus kurashikiensis]GBG14523.1 uncharacterized protein NMK_2122 [Novimethylophilus kurashikiensis]
MSHSIVVSPAEQHWKAPGATPATVGEYLAALEPASADPGNRRWWNGKSWSKPYNVCWPEELKAQARAELDDFFPYWVDARLD